MGYYLVLSDFHEFSFSFCASLWLDVTLIVKFFLGRCKSLLIYIFLFPSDFCESSKVTVDRCRLLSNISWVIESCCLEFSVIVCHYESFSFVFWVGVCCFRLLWLIVDILWIAEGVVDHYGLFWILASPWKSLWILVDILGRYELIWVIVDCCFFE